MLLAEKLFLLLLKDDGHALMHGSIAEIPIAGAVLAELALRGNIRTAEEGESDVRKGRVVIVPEGPAVDDPILQRGIEMVEDSWTKSASMFLQGWQRGWRALVSARLVQAETLSDKPFEVFGVPVFHHYEIVDPRPREDLLNRLDPVLFNGASPDVETATLAAFLAATHMTVKVMSRGRKVDKGALKRAAKVFLEQSWAARATERAIQSQEAAAASAGH